MVGPDDLPAVRAAAWPLAPVPYPADLAARRVTGCVALACMIGPDGTTSEFRTLDAASSSRSPLAGREAV